MIYVCDAIMGSGKFSAAIRFINAHPEKRFIYVAVYLDEAERIKNACPRTRFVEPSEKIIVKLGIDGFRGKVEKYSVGQSQEALRQALIEANNGKTYLDIRDIRDGKCVGLFSIIEQILNVTVVEGLQGDEYFNSFVEFRNVAQGDSPEFIVEDYDLYVVAEVADGTQGIRRQRLSGSTSTTIPTSMKAVRIYEELNRVLAGRVDFNTFITRVSESFRQKLLNDIYTLWGGATADQFGGETYFPQAGAFDEDELLDLVAHVEAAAGGKPATIVGTKKALRKIKESIDSDGAKDELHAMGYAGKFYGTPVATTDFIMADDYVTVIAGDSKPIKVVYEGDPLVLLGNPMTNADLTQEYLYAEKYGMGILLAGRNTGIGRYEMT